MSQTASTISIKVANDEQSYTHKHLVYSTVDSPIVLSHDDTTLKQLVDQAVSAFKGIPSDVTLTIKLTW